MCKSKAMLLPLCVFRRRQHTKPGQLLCEVRWGRFPWSAGYPSSYSPCQYSGPTSRNWHGLANVGAFVGAPARSHDLLPLQGGLDSGRQAKPLLRNDVFIARRQPTRCNSERRERPGVALTGRAIKGKSPAHHSPTRLLALLSVSFNALCPYYRR